MLDSVVDWVLIYHFHEKIVDRIWKKSIGLSMNETDAK